MASTTDWRPTTYADLQELKAELDAIDAAARDGRLRTTGGWTAGQILEHCGKFVRMSFDGFDDTKVPRVVRLLGAVLLKPRIGKSHMKPGIRLPGSASALLPREGVSFEEGMGQLRAQLARIEAGERMTRDSPVLERMTHELWLGVHLDHCRLHLGFVRTD
jgi:hypothetical protein